MDPYYEAVKVPEGVTWDEAKAAAEAMGGHLVTIESPNENQFVYGLVASDPGYWSKDGKNGKGPWLGG